MLGQRIMKSIMVPLAGTTSVEALQTNIETIRIILSRCEVSKRFAIKVDGEG